MIKEVTPEKIVRYCRLNLNLPDDGQGIDDPFLAAMLRRVAGFNCSCPRTELRSALLESLSKLSQQSKELSARLDSIIDDLIVVGDLLELSDVTNGDLEAKGTWVFAAPPSFVVRKSGSIFLTGIMPDQNTSLPKSIRSRVVYSNCTRTIKPGDGEDLAAVLDNEGFRRLPEELWLKAPRSVLSNEILSNAQERLAAEQECAPVQGLTIVDPDTKPTYYKKRWTSPKDHSGFFVARRPQEFGAPLWCFAEIRSGLLKRIIDLPFRSYRWRGCDAAWHLQMAIDFENNAPQRYTLEHEDDGTCRFSFYSPIPLWAERRLMVLGKKGKGTNCLFAYEIPTEEAAQEEEFLQRNLWLSPFDTSSKNRSE